MSEAIIRTFELGPAPWPTIDPFLFCVHHNDAYPAGDGAFAPKASLEGRHLGQDFAGIDGWNMYHGRDVPGFPQHPHRGFETISYVRRGLMDHADSLGATARFGSGDVQWMTAGSGIVHSEMFPLLETDEPNPLELFQIWINLPPADKLTDPHFTMLWAGEIPVVEPAVGVRVTVIAGPLGSSSPPAPPPKSWAARAEADVAIWHIRLEGGASWSLPPAAGPETGRTLYLFDAGEVTVDGRSVAAGSAAIVDPSRPLPLRAGADTADILLLQGRPIGEPVAQYGPFVMNTRAEIEQAFHDYQASGFGGWPWPSDDPNHGGDPRRFARHPDGRMDRAPTG